MKAPEIISVIALFVSALSFGFAAATFFRDKIKLVVTLQWDLEASANSGLEQGKKWGVITVTNVGRRAVYFSHVALSLPKGHEETHLVIMGGLAGDTLTEGAPVKVYTVEQDGMEAYAKDWRGIAAQVSDATGKVWKSVKLNKKQRPSWAAVP